MKLITSLVVLGNLFQLCSGQAANVTDIDNNSGCAEGLFGGLTGGRCIRFKYANDGSTPSIEENILKECGPKCEPTGGATECPTQTGCVEQITAIATDNILAIIGGEQPTIDASIINNLTDCAACAEWLINLANNTFDESCGEPQITVSETRASLCLPNFVINLLTQEECCANPCYSPTSEAIVKDVGRVLVKNLNVGDQVLTGSGNYDTVYTIDHADPKRNAEFVQIHSSLMDTPLELTEEHMVFLEGKATPVPAKAIQVGDALQTLDEPSIVTKIDRVKREGVYNVITTDGTMAVDGIVTSNYNVHFRSGGNGELELGGRSIMSYHEFIHLLMTPYRAFCVGTSFSFCKTNEKYNGYDQVGKYILDLGRNQSEFTQNTMIYIAIGFAYLFKFLNMVVNPYVGTGLVLGTGSYYFYSKKN